jgi:hypothetical protein
VDDRTVQSARRSPDSSWWRRAVLANSGIHGPDGYGTLGSLSDDGSAELLLVLEHG